MPWMLPLVALAAIVLALDYFWSSDSSGSWVPQSERAGASDPASGPADGGKAGPSATSQKSGPPAEAATDSSKGTPAARPAAETTTSATQNAASTAARATPPAKTPPTPAGQRPAEPPAGKADAKTPAADSNPPVDTTPEKAPAPGTAKTATSSGETARGEATVAGSSDAAANSTALPEREATAGRPAPPREGVLIVGEPDEGGRVFNTLHAACTAAKSGDVIELRYNGVREERPIALANSKLTIRAGDRYTPIVRFRPTEPDPVKSPRSMIALAGGQLTLINLQIELEVPRSVPADHWMMFALENVDQIRVDHCILTVRNAGFGQAAYHAGVAFFSLHAPPGSTSILHDPNSSEDRTVNIQLHNCLARGEATFIQSDDLQGVRLNWDNGWLATSERLLSVGGGAQPQQTGPIEISLQHVTALTRSGLAMINDGLMPAAPTPVEFKCSDSILALPAAAAAPLIEQRHNDRLADYHSRLQWTGDRDFYQGYEIFWKIVGNAPDDTLQMTFAPWQAAWGEARENLARVGNVHWKSLPGMDVPFSEQTPADYVLSGDDEITPLGNASDGRDVGHLADRLPAPGRSRAVDAAGDGP